MLIIIKIKKKQIDIMPFTAIKNEKYPNRLYFKISWLNPNHA